MRTVVWFFCLYGLLATRVVALDVPDLAKYPGAEAGLVVIVDPASDDAAIAVARQQHYLIATLEDDLAAVPARNQALVAAGVYPVAQCHPWWFADRLPFRNNSVDVVILREGLDENLTAEAQRVLAPGTGLVLIEKNGAWQEQRKPRPAGMATWLGFAADGSNSFYSPDQTLNEVNSVQFMHGGSRKRQTHPFSADDRIMVQAADFFEGRQPFSGVLRWRSQVRTFKIPNSVGAAYTLAGDYLWWLDWIKDVGQLRSIHRLTGEEREPIDVGPTFPSRGQSSDAMSRFYRVVSDGKTVFVTGSYHTLIAVDAVTNKEVWRAEFPEFVEFVAVSSGLLVAQLSSTGNPPRKVGFGWNCNIAEAVIGIDPASGKVLWRNEEAKGKPTHNLLVDDEKVVACSFLPHEGVPENRADVEWYQPKLYLHVMERDTGKTRFFRTDFKDIQCNNSIQMAAVWPARIGVMKDNNLAIFDARTGETINQYQGPGYKLCFPAISPRHFWTGNAAIPLDDPNQMNMHGHDLINPRYNYRNAVANGMLLTPSHFITTNSARIVPGAAALVYRAPEEWQAMAWDDPRRTVKAGTAAWAAPSPADWPTLRGNFERTAWLPGTGVVPARLAWEQRPKRLVADDTAPLIRSGWRDNGVVAGVVTHPVVQGNRVVVAIPDEHRLIGYDRTTGEQVWTRLLPGRTDTAPTLAGETAYVGTDDGMVTAIRLSDGEIVWQFFAAPGADLIFDHDQISNLYRVPSAPVLHDGALWVSAGRHSRLEMGIAVWKLDPATGKVLGRAMIDEAWVGPDTRPRFRRIGNGGAPVYRPSAHINDTIQVRRGQLCIVNTLVDPKTMEVTPFESDPTHQEIHPERGGIGGGTTWVRPYDQTIGYRLDGVYVQATNAFTSPGMILNREMGIFAMLSSRGSIFIKPLGFDSTAFKDLPKENIVDLPTDKMQVTRAFAARGNLLYLATRHFDKKLHLMVVDHRAPDKALADVAFDAISSSEEIIPDGIAVTDDMVILVTSEGRVLAFDAQKP